MDPPYYAKMGDVDYFKTVELDVIMNYRDDINSTILSIAADLNQLECCQVIYERCPSHLFLANAAENNILHRISYYGDRIIRLLKFFLEAGARAAKDDIESGHSRGENIRFKEWLKARNNHEETAFIRGFRWNNPNLEAARLWIQVDIDNELQQFSIPDANKNTPLHLAVTYQDLELVKLLSAHEPDFEYGANNNEETPLLIAMGRVSPIDTGDSTSAKIIKLFLEKQPNQSKVRTGDKGWTALHHATQKGNLGCIDAIIQFCPDCMEAVDNEGENFLHLAAKLGQLKVVKHILETEDIDDSFLNAKDNYGNTPLHIAAKTGNQNLVECLLYDRRVNKKTTNAKGEKVLDMITFEYDKEKAGVYGVRDRMNEKELKDQSDFDLVVGALIATVSFTAGITVPGGYNSAEPNSGMAVLAKSKSFEVFVISNTFALAFSLYAVFSHFCTRRLLKRADIVYQLNVATSCILIAIFAMMVSFITGSYSVLAISNRIAITVIVICCCFFVFAFRALWRMVMQYKHSGAWNYTTPF